MSDTQLENNACQAALSPRHIAIIMDGNGRWAQKRGLPREEGHIAGSEKLRDIIDAGVKLGIRYLTMYAFSTENWQRPQEEVDALMELLANSLVSETPTLKERNVRLFAIGNIDRLPEKARKCLHRSIQECSANTGLTLTLALSYSARWELTTAMQSLAADVAAGAIKPQDIDEAVIAQRLNTAELPDPDLLIRTGGEQRISNFLLWQLAYAELYFTDIHWPDFGEKELREAIEDYRGRQRRFGLTGAQVTNQPG